MRKTFLHFLGYTLVAFIFFIVGANYRDYDVRRKAQEASARSLRFYNTPAPLFTSTTAGLKPWSISEHAGKVIVLEFWATWCPPCVEAIPSFKQLYDRFKNRSDFELVGISLDGNDQVVKQFCESKKMEWEQLVEPNRGWDNSVARTFEVTGVPLTCVIDKKGIIRMYNHAPGSLEPFIEKLLSESNISENKL